MIDQQCEGINQRIEQWALFHFAQADQFKRLKMASVNNPALFYQYGEQQFFNKALAFRYKAMIASSLIPYTKMVESAENNTQISREIKSLLNLLLNGGYILYTRHGESTVGEDQANIDFQNCSTQRNLSENGKRQAVSYGEILRSLYIPVNYPVLASPFCRARETAELAFGEENVQVDPFWGEIYKLSGNLNEREQERILKALQSALEIIPPLGTNKVIIAHSFPKAFGLNQIPDMGTVVVKPLGDGKGYEVVALITLTELSDLLK